MNTLKAELGGIEIHVPEDMIAVFNSIVNIYNEELQSHKDYFHEKLHFLQAQFFFSCRPSGMGVISFLINCRWVPSRIFNWIYLIYLLLVSPITIKAFMKVSKRRWNTV